VVPQNSQFGAGASVFAEEVKTRTGGKYRIEQYPNGALGGDVEMIQGVRGGQIDIAFIANAAFTSIIPEFGIFDIPFRFRNSAHAHAVLDGPIGQEYLKKFADKDMVALA
jgi:TRAP-type transport system periplasmic protein